MGTGTVVGMMTGCSCGTVVGCAATKALGLSVEDGSRMIFRASCGGAGAMIGSTGGVIADVVMTNE